MSVSMESVSVTVIPLFKLFIYVAIYDVVTGSEACAASMVIPLFATYVLNA